MTRPEARKYAIDEQGMTHKVMMGTFSRLLTECSIIGTWDDREPDTTRPTFSWDGFDPEKSVACMACIARSKS